MKLFKYCTEDELTNAFENYKYGGTTNLIYVWINDNYVETLEVFPHDIHMLIFKNADEMYEWFKESGTPLIKDFAKGQQAELF